LGKTVTTIAAAEELIDYGEAKCVLVICPASIKWQWSKQIAKFTDGALVKVIEGPPQHRRAQYRGVKRGDYEWIICNYEQITNDWDIIRHLEFDVIVCDEIVAIKSPGAKRSRHVKRLRATFKWGLTGQPIENRPEELYSIMEWIDPKLLGNFRTFDRVFILRDRWGKPTHYRNLGVLRKHLQPVLDRKRRDEVADQMPKVSREEYLVEFDPKAWRLYRHIAHEIVDLIYGSPKFGSFNLDDHYAGADDARATGDVMARICALRMLCDHPRLLDFSADNFDDPTTKAGSLYANALRQKFGFSGLTARPKLDETISLINDILDASRKNKIVLFSFFKPMLSPLISDRLKCDYELFTGDLSPHDREKAKERFLSDPHCRVLLSSDAGGVGLDLPVANYLISYDLPFSAGKLNQRERRIDRLSSTWPQITLITMMMRSSIEERMADMLAQKQAIASAWLDGEGVDRTGTLELTLGTLAGFLEETAR
jgi:SNF2 family DNA or RNA helicase